MNHWNNSEIPSADIVGTEIVKEYHELMLYDFSINRWKVRNNCSSLAWTLIPDVEMEAFAIACLDSKGIHGYGSYSYVTDIVFRMRCEVLTSAWYLLSECRVSHDS